MEHDLYATFETARIVRKAGPTAHFGIASLDFEDSDGNNFRGILQKMSRVEKVSLYNADKFAPEVLESCFRAMAEHDGALQEIDLGYHCTVERSATLADAADALFLKHGATLRRIAGPAWLKRLPSFVAQCTALTRIHGCAVEAFAADENATLPAATSITITHLLEQADGDVDLVERFIDNCGKNRTAVRILSAGYGLALEQLPLMLVAARRCPLVTELEIPGETDPATLKQLLHSLPWLRRLKVEFPFSEELREHFSVLCRPDVPQLAEFELIGPLGPLSDLEGSTCDDSPMLALDLMTYHDMHDGDHGVALRRQFVDEFAPQCRSHLCAC